MKCAKRCKCSCAILMRAFEWTQEFMLIFSLDGLLEVIIRHQPNFHRIRLCS